MLILKCQYHSTNSLFRFIQRFRILLVFSGFNVFFNLVQFLWQRPLRNTHTGIWMTLWPNMSFYPQIHPFICPYENNFTLHSAMCGVPSTNPSLYMRCKSARTEYRFTAHRHAQGGHWCTLELKNVQLMEGSIASSEDTSNQESDWHDDFTLLTAGEVSLFSW